MTAMAMISAATPAMAVTTVAPVETTAPGFGALLSAATPAPAAVAAVAATEPPTPEPEMPVATLPALAMTTPVAAPPVVIPRTAAMSGAIDPAPSPPADAGVAPAVLAAEARPEAPKLALLANPAPPVAPPPRLPASATNSNAPPVKASVAVRGGDPVADAAAAAPGDDDPANPAIASIVPVAVPMVVAPAPLLTTSPKAPAPAPAGVMGSRSEAAVVAPIPERIPMTARTLATVPTLGDIAAPLPAPATPAIPGPGSTRSATVDASPTRSAAAIATAVPGIVTPPAESAERPAVVATAAVVQFAAAIVAAAPAPAPSPVAGVAQAALALPQRPVAASPSNSVRPAGARPPPVLTATDPAQPETLAGGVPDTATPRPPVRTIAIVEAPAPVPEPRAVTGINSSLEIGVASTRLGAVRIGIEGAADDLRVSLGLSPAAAAIVAVDTPRLLADLAASGVRVQALDVSAGGYQPGGSGQTPAQHGSSARSNPTTELPVPSTPPRAARASDRYA